MPWIDGTGATFVSDAEYQLYHNQSVALPVWKEDEDDPFPDLAGQVGGAALTFDASSYLQDGDNVVYSLSDTTYATIDPASGMVTFNLATAVGDGAVDVIAKNERGSAVKTLTFSVAEAAGGVQLTQLPDADWDTQEDDNDPGRRQVSVAASVTVPAGYELRFYLGPTQNPTPTTQITVVVDPGATFTTNGRLTPGDTNYTRGWWYNVATGSFEADATTVKQFTIAGGGATQPPTPGVPGQTQKLNQVSSEGVTLFFDGQVDVQYAADGQPVVITNKQIRVTRTDPPARINGGRAMHGMARDEGKDYDREDLRKMNGDGPGQCYDGAPSNVSANTVPYRAQKQVDPGITGNPVVIQAGSNTVLTKARSLNNPGHRTNLASLGVFTFTSQPLSAVALRPPPWNAAKRHRGTISDIDRSRVPKLAAPGSVPPYNDVKNFCGHFHNHMHNTGTKQTVFPKQTMYYQQSGFAGREYAYMSNEVLLWLMTDAGNDAQWMDVATHAYQQGAEICERIKIGCVYIDDGQLYIGRKPYAWFYAWMSQDPDGIEVVKAFPRNKYWTKSHKVAGGKFHPDRPGGVGPPFAEDRSIVAMDSFYRNPSLQKDYQCNSKVRPPYLYNNTNQWNGKPEWGIEATSNPTKMRVRTGICYRDSNSVWPIAASLYVRVCQGGKAIWGHDAGLDLVDFEPWYLTGGVSPNAPSKFAKDMWKQHNGKILGPRVAARNFNR